VQEARAVEDLEQSQSTDESNDGTDVEAPDAGGENQEQADAAEQASATDSSSDAGDAEEGVGAGDQPA